MNDDLPISPHLGSAERRLLLSVLDVRHPLAVPAQQAIDWASLLKVARYAKILPTLAQRLLPDADAPSEQLSTATRLLLRDAWQETAVYNTRVLLELARTVSILRGAGIDHVALKGAALVVRDYPHPTMRHMVDLDLLIDPARFDEAVVLLRARGFVDDPLYTATLVGDGSSIAAAWPSGAHTCAPLKGPNGVTLDLHHRVPTSGFDASGGFRGWLARSQPCLVHGESVQLCGRLDLAVHLCEHFVLQHHGDPEDAPRLLCDLRALFPDQPPWGQLQRGPWPQRVAVALVRRLYEAAFASEGSSDRIDQFLQRIAVADPAVTTWLAELTHLSGHASRFSFNVLNRPRYALRTVFPTRAFMAQRYGVDPRSLRIYPLYVSRLLTTPFAPFLRSK